VPKLETFPMALVGGLQDSKPVPEPSDLQTLTNFVPFRGRFAIRAPVTETARLLSDVAHESPTNVDHVLAIRYHDAKMYVAAWRGGAVNRTYLYRLESTGLPEGGGPTASPIATIWTGASVPKPMMVSFSGGSAVSTVKRLYIADYTEQYDTVFWDGATITTVTEDLDDSGAKENLRFNVIFAYQHHLWGAGFYQGTVRRPEIIRFSRPGLIAENEPVVINNILREWWSVDFRPFGTRGEKVVAYGYAGGAAIIFKRREVYALMGYDSDSWAAKTLSTRVGAVGNRAAASTEDGLCFFWSEKGPHVTDGQEVKDIGESIRRRVQEAGLSEDTTVEYSPDDGIVYFDVPSSGTGAADKPFAFDKTRGLWVDASWLKTGGGVLKASMLTAVPDETLPGPAAAPSSLAATAVSDTQINLTWVNGDTALEVTTDIHRSTSSGFTPDAGNKIAAVGSGVASYQNTTGLSQITTYYYKVRHLRNGTFSAASNEANAKTWLSEPTLLDASGLSNGIRVVLTNNADGADIEIERKLSGGSYTLLTTLLAQTTGVKTHDDTTATCANTYFYRSRVTKTGETTSEYSNEDSAVACNAPPDLITVSHDPGLEVDCPGDNNAVVTWSGTNFTSDDTAKVYQNDNGAGYVLVATVPLTNGSFAHRYPYKTGGTTRTLRYKVEAYDGGTSLSDTLESTLSSNAVTFCQEV